MKECKIVKEDINTVILIGGASKLEKMQTTIKKEFQGSEILKKVNGQGEEDHSLCFAMGAAMKAEQLRNKFFVPGDIFQMQRKTAKVPLPSPAPAQVKPSEEETKGRPANVISSPFVVESNMMV